MPAHGIKEGKTKRIAIISGMMCTMLLASCAGGSSEADEGVRLNTGVIYNPNTAIMQCGFGTMQEDEGLQEAGIELSVADSSQLGSEDEMIQQVVSGQLDFGMSVGSIYAVVLDNPDLEVFETYYLYDDVEDVNTAFATDVAEEIWDNVRDESGIVRVGDPWLYGARHMFGNVAIRSLDDFTGTDVRVPETSVSVGSVNALGGNPTSVAYSELYLALQQGIADVAEAPINIMATESFDEASSYVSLTNHLVSSNILTFNEDTWEGLSSEQQDALESSINEAAAAVQECVLQEDEEILAEYEASSNIEVIRDVDTDSMREAVENNFVPNQSWSDLHERLVQEMGK